MANELNLDVAGAVSDLEVAVNELQLRLKFYKTLFRGKGLDFDGYRTYTQEDDAIYIDWKASKRANKLLTKQYIEEKDRKIVFVVDLSGNMLCGSTDKLKCEYAAEVVLALSHLIWTSGDKIGLLIHNNHVIDYVPPSRGKRQFDYFIDILSNGGNYGGKQDINSALDFLCNYVSSAVKAVFIVSDFLTMKKDSYEMLKTIGGKFETVAIMVKDPVDISLPDDSGEVLIEDPSTGQKLLVNPKVARMKYEAYARQQENAVREMFKETEIDLLSLSTNDSFVNSLAEFLKERIRKRVFA
jgi:uncharacterized protein (DUF58 family)